MKLWKYISPAAIYRCVFEEEYHSEGLIHPLAGSIVWLSVNKLTKVEEEGFSGFGEKSCVIPTEQDKDVYDKHRSV